MEEGHNNGIAVTRQSSSTTSATTTRGLHSILEALRRPLAAQVRISARAFAIWLPAFMERHCYWRQLQPLFAPTLESRLTITRSWNFRSGSRRSGRQWRQHDAGRVVFAGTISILSARRGLRFVASSTSGALTNPAGRSTCPRGWRCHASDHPPVASSHAGHARGQWCRPRRMWRSRSQYCFAR